MSGKSGILKGILEQLKFAPVGGKALRDVDEDVLLEAVDAIRMKNLSKGIEVESGTGAARDEIARRHAVDMLSLSPDNTAMDRARAMGFYDGMPLFHGMSGELRGGGFNLETPGATSGNVGMGELGVSSALNPDVAREFSLMGSAKKQGLSPQDLPPVGYFEGEAILPLFHMSERPGVLQLSDNLLNHEIVGAARDAYDSSLTSILFKNNTSPKGLEQQQVLHTKPENLRSKFAAFDPARKNERDILAPLALPAAGAGLMTATALSPGEAQAARVVQDIKTRDLPLEDAYSPVDMFLAGATGGGGLLSRTAEAAFDPLADVATDKVMEALAKLYGWATR